MAKKMSNKDPWKGLSIEWRTDMESKHEPELIEITSKIALEDCAVREAKENDFDLKTKQEAAKEAGAIYADVAKTCRLKVKYIRQLREGRGNKVPTSGDIESDIAAQREEQGD